LLTFRKTQVVIDGDEKLTPCSPGAPGATEMAWTDIESDKLLEPPLVLKDFIKAVKNSRPTVSGDDLEKNADWTAQFGSEGQ
jgi:vacuolar protein-sorting-associated protein 4